MSDSNSVRQRVMKSYAAVVTSTSPACCGPPEQKGVAVKVAGYEDSELADLPPDAVVNSFGCGNPLAFSEVGEGDVVLDLGSGAGIDLLLAARKVGPTGRVIGVDMTDEMLERARANIAASGLDNIEVRKGLIEELPVETASVDWVISNCVINLSPEKDRVFAEIARVLKPGGRMSISDLVAEELPPEVRDHPVLLCSCVAGTISEQDYCDGLTRAGLIDVEVRERITYDAAQLEAVVASDAELGVDLDACCGEASDAEGGPSLSRQIRACVGKIWSAKIFARKA